MMTYTGPPIAVIGASAISAFGHQWHGLGRALLEGQGPEPGSAVSSIPGPEDAVERNARKLMSRGALLGSLAVRAALRSIAPWSAPYHDLGYYLAVGASGGDMAQLEAMLGASMVRKDPTSAGHELGLALSMEDLGTRGLRKCNPLFAFQLMNNFTLCHGAMLEDIRGPNAAFFSRGGGTVVALVEAAHAIASGACSRALAGGADSALHPVTRDVLAQRGFADIVPGEGAALLALSGLSRSEHDAPRAIAYLAACALHPDGRESETPLHGRADIVVLAACDERARHALASRVRARHPGAAIVDANARLGESLAAGPALSWVAALDLLRAGDAERVVACSAGVDGDVGEVYLARTRTSPVSRAARSATRHLEDETRVPVITGCGVVSAFGVGTERFFDALCAGESAISTLTSFDARTFPTRVAGQVPDAGYAAILRALDERLAPDEARDRKLPMGLHAALEAWRHADCGPAERHASTCLALGLEQALLEDFAGVFALEERQPGRSPGRIDWSRVDATRGPRTRFRTEVDDCARALRRELGLEGPTAVHVSACAAGALSVAHAAACIARGQTDTVLTGAADSMLNPLGLGGMSRLGAPSPRAEASACRPFDARRDGLVMGEGAAIFVVESLARARARGVPIVARILGWGSTQDAYKATAPRPDGSAAIQAMRSAMACARISPEHIDYINAHGTGTPLGDIIEARAIAAVLGARARDVPVSSIKGAIGHLMAASGAIELAACLLPFARGVLPGTAHLEELDPGIRDALGPDNVLRAPRALSGARDIAVVMSNSFGFGGQNATVILGRPEA